MKNYIITLFAIALVFSAGCARIDEVEMASSNISINVQNVESQDVKSTKCILEPVKIAEDLYVSAIEEDWEMPSSDSTEDTKGTIVTTETFYTTHKTNGFRVSAYQHGETTTFINNIQFKPDLGMGWQPGTAVAWPDYASDFYAYAPYNAGTFTSASKTLTHTVSTTNTSQVDLLVAKRENVPAKYDNVLQLSFDHALCAVKFVTNSKMPAGKITQIKITNVYVQGTYDFTTGEWSGQTTSSSITAGSLNVVTQDGAPDIEMTNESQNFFLIPQTCGATSELQITFALSGTATSTTGNLSATTIKIPLKDIVLKPGKIITFRIGADSDYTFELTNPEQHTLVFTNTTSDSTPANVKVTSTKKVSQIATTVLQNWEIKSYTINGETVEVDGNSFNAGGLSVSKSGNELSVTALARGVLYNRGSHDYWINSNGRTEDLDWSPADWSTVSALSPIDLSKMDYTKEKYSSAVEAFSMTTANCYIIRHAGTYKLPLVYGNAVVNGTDNVQSYYPNVIGGSNRLDRFVNSVGAGIESPFIENAEGCGGSDLKCAIVWQDQAEVIQNITLVGNLRPGNDYSTSTVRYLQFEVPQSSICQNNALICIYKDKDGGTTDKYDSGEAIWSWHIWTTNDPALLNTSISVTNLNSKESKFFPIFNLGWIDAAYYPKKEDVMMVLSQWNTDNKIEITVKQNAVVGQSFGCFYQFGRKDPMPTADVDGFKKNGGFKSSLAKSICNPGCFYTAQSPELNWCDTNFNNLWTGKKSETGVLDQDDEMIKTIYDPSPIGYKMPASSAFTGFTVHGNNTDKDIEFNVNGPFAMGWYFYTKKMSEKSTASVFFPTAGYRLFSSGSIKYDDTHGRYWSAMPEDKNTGYNLYFNPGVIYPISNYFRSDGFSVRPVIDPTMPNNPIR